MATPCNNHQPPVIPVVVVVPLLELIGVHGSVGGLVEGRGLEKGVGHAPSSESGRGREIVHGVGEYRPSLA